LQGKKEENRDAHPLLVALPAPPAISLNLEGVGYTTEPVGAAQFLLDSLEFWRKDLRHFPAFHAYQVIMVFMSEYMLIMGMLVISFNLLNETAFHEKGECPVYGSLGDLDLSLSDACEEFVGVEMTVMGEDLCENPLPLFRELQAFLGKKFPEDLPLHDVS